MSKRKGTVQVRIGPRLGRPAIAGIAIVGLIYDSAHLHLLHHLLGSFSPVVVWVVVVSVLFWAAFRLGRWLVRR